MLDGSDPTLGDVSGTITTFVTKSLYWGRERSLQSHEVEPFMTGEMLAKNF